MEWWHFHEVIYVNGGGDMANMFFLGLRREICPNEWFALSIVGVVFFVC